MRRIRAVLRLCVASTLLLAAACGTSQSLQGTLGDVGAAIESLIRRGSMPSEHVATIRAMNEPGVRQLRRDIDDAADETREAIRELGAADYSTWHDAALVVHILSSISTDHTAALIRIEAIDTLARMAPWTLDAQTEPPVRATESEVIEALKVVTEAVGKDDSDAALSTRVAGAIRTFEGAGFDAGRSIRDGASPSAAAREYRARLRNARGVLSSLTGSTLDGFMGDTEVREGLDRAYVSLSASTIRLTLLAAANGDSSPTTRAAAVRQLSLLQSPESASAIARAVERDPHSTVRREAAVALGRFGPDVALRPLVAALSDDMADVRGAAVRALTHATGEQFGDDRAAWNRWWQAREAETSNREPGDE